MKVNEIVFEEIVMFVFGVELEVDDWVFKKLFKKDKKKVEKVVCFVMFELVEIMLDIDELVFVLEVELVVEEVVEGCVDFLK